MASFRARKCLELIESAIRPHCSEPDTVWHTPDHWRMGKCKVSYLKAGYYCRKKLIARHSGPSIMYVIRNSSGTIFSQSVGCFDP